VNTLGRQRLKELASQSEKRVRGTVVSKETTTEGSKKPQRRAKPKEVSARGSPKQRVERVQNLPGVESL